MTDQQIIAKINYVLKKVDDFFNFADVIPEKYQRVKEQANSDEKFPYRILWLQDAEHQIKPNQNMFSFSADEIEKYKIPSYVVGCSGRANLFAKYANQAGIKDVFIVPCVKISDINKQKMNGHQIIAVKMSNGLQLLNPGRGIRDFNHAKLNGNCKLNEAIDALNHGKKEYQIAAVMTQEEHEKITTRQKLMEVYKRVKTSQLKNAIQKIKEKITNSKIFQKFFQYENK